MAWTAQQHCLDNAVINLKTTNQIKEINMKKIMILMLLSFTAHADYYVLPEVQQSNPVLNNPIADNYNANRMRQIEEQKLQIMQQQQMQQDLQRIQEQQYMINQQQHHFKPIE